MNLSILGRLAVGYANRLDLIVVAAVKALYHGGARAVQPNKGRPACPIFMLGGQEVDVVPSRYETLLVYYERTNPEAFNLLYDPEEDLKEDERWLANKATSLGLPVVKIGNATAYPTDLLMARMG
ncbi:hypothetical protein [Sinorhizobium meliloti]|uniref:Uncharacterized protein n=1 Tax=Rhizobium meliloti TaxID=382 RepID=A0AAW9TPJ8_RHIML|nr:hypothetical protein [Sinorhizobium meliloti]MQW33592.1 hypothetical protein [Sinorhizobium meliloti]MQW46076.1 hypothetical protein [Sinorhizobium meliloti]